MPPGLITTGYYSLGLTGIWLLGRAAISLGFVVLVKSYGYTPFFGTIEFAILATFSLILTSVYSDVLDSRDLTPAHLALIFTTWVAVLPFWYVSPFRVGSVSKYAVIGIVSIVWLAVLEESRKRHSGQAAD